MVTCYLRVFFYLPNLCNGTVNCLVLCQQSWSSLLFSSIYLVVRTFTQVGSLKQQRSASIHSLLIIILLNTNMYSSSNQYDIKSNPSLSSRQHILSAQLIDHPVQSSTGRVNVHSHCLLLQCSIVVNLPSLLSFLIFELVVFLDHFQQVIDYFLATTLFCNRPGTGILVDQTDWARSSEEWFILKVRPNCISGRCRSLSDILVKLDFGSQSKQAAYS